MKKTFFIFIALLSFFALTGCLLEGNTDNDFAHYETYTISRTDFETIMNGYNSNQTYSFSEIKAVKSNLARKSTIVPYFLVGETRYAGTSNCSELEFYDFISIFYPTDLERHLQNFYTIGNAIAYFYGIDDIILWIYCEKL